MNKTLQRNETREHLLATGEQLCLQRGFTGMGLSELLAQAAVPKGSFYYYFRSKEAFGVALLERYFLQHHQQVTAQLQHGEGTPRERLLSHFRSAERLFSEQGLIVGCLAVKLSAEVCDLSEPMRDALQHGASRIVATYAQTLEAAAQHETLSLPFASQEMANLIYILWLGASLQSKLSREPLPLRLALSTIEQWLQPH
ncbi:TetR/AcrR family transcriptional regulator [Pantoea sp. KPR_PJ]|uniref:TetR/AcrR family transcriptional regulator n=1 Tax=Pantoea sp. KPR_PJ TaxID=2738375 RepID=UPI0035270EAE